MGAVQIRFGIPAKRWRDRWVKRVRQVIHKVVHTHNLQIELYKTRKTKNTEILGTKIEQRCKRETITSLDASNRFAAEGGAISDFWRVARHSYRLPPA
jgi:hypothetical protein